MAAVDDEPGILAHPLKAAGPGDGAEALQKGLIRDIPAPAAQNLHGIQHRAGVLQLILPQKGHGNLAVLPPGEALAHEVRGEEPELGEPAFRQLRACLPADSFHHAPDAGILIPQDHGAAGLDDARLFGGDGLHSVAQDLGVIQTDAGDDRRLRRVDDVGGVQAAAKAHLQHHDVALCLLKEAEGDGRYQLKLGRGVRHGFRRQLHPLRGVR